MARKGPPRPRPRRRLYTLRGGPFAGASARLEAGTACTLPVTVRDWRGRYVRDDDALLTLAWEPAPGSRLL